MVKVNDELVTKVVNAIEWDVPSLHVVTDEELEAVEAEGFITRDHPHSSMCVFAASDKGEAFVAETPSIAEALENKRLG